MNQEVERQLNVALRNALLNAVAASDERSKEHDREMFWGSVVFWSAVMISAGIFGWWVYMRLF